MQFQRFKKDRDEYFKEILASYNSLAEQSYTMDQVLKIYPKISDAENFLRIEKYLSAIRKIIRQIKTMKYEIPTSLELNEESFQYKRVIAQSSDITSLEQNLNQQHQ